MRRSAAVTGLAAVTVAGATLCGCHKAEECAFPSSSATSVAYVCASGGGRVEARGS